MKHFIAFVLSTFTLTQFSAQELILPNYHHSSEALMNKGEDYRSKLGLEITTPPDFPVRTMAEWEEIQSLVITWAGFNRILKQIAFHAKQECEVIIIASNENTVINYLNSNNAGGPPFDNLDNITIIEDNFDSIWGRDYGAHTIYRDDVDELLLVDWIYNRNRPADDNIPITIAQHAGVPLYSTTEEPYDLMATGGNFMSDGMGTGFSSELILEENEGGMTWWGAQFPDHTVEDIDNIVFDFMGIDRYIKMEVLPYDLIHHIDMHMKLLDEETILMGEYPAGVADGPQIEANLEYVLSNYESSFGTPYEVVRIQMPPDGNAYPNTSGDYRTYTNLVFVNKTVIVPTYEEQYDAPALEILAEQLPGYNVVGIQCNDIIQLSGAIHCITKAVGVSDPLLIVHDHLDDTDNETDDYQVDATIQHVSDINEASVFYSINGADFIETSMVMTSTIDDTWTAYIPAQPQGTEIDYYIDAMANSGKEQVRPIVAPEGHWTFNIVGEAVGIEELAISSPISAVYPNPANGITVVQLDMPTITSAVRLSLKDMLGRDVLDIHAGTLARGQNKFFFNAETLPAGVYSVVLEAGDQRYTTPLMVR